MNSDEFRKYGHEFVDWIADYFNDIETYRVVPDVKPRDIINRLPKEAPLDGESFERIFEDFQRIILPGMTHWQSPSFHAYFPANNSYPSVLAEMLTSAMGAQCMMWQTSPAAAELEELTADWLKQMMGLPESMHGVIQDTASTATLTAILSAREFVTDFNSNNAGLNGKILRVYCSTETHSSIEKAVKIAGIGRENLVKIPVDDNYSMRPDLLKEAIESDKNKGYIPACVVAALGTTGSTAVDDLQAIAEICNKSNVWFHIDAAYAGSALILPEMQHYIRDIARIDSFVFNPHKWLMTNFDCSMYYVKDKGILIRTFEIMPEYLKTMHDSQVNNYRDWGIQLGRRFRALKLWFVLRTYGVKGLQAKIRADIELAKYAEKSFRDRGDIEILAPVNFNLVCFRYNDESIREEELNRINDELLQEINRTGQVFLSHTKLNDKFAIRFVIGQTNVKKHHVDKVLEILDLKINNIKGIK